MTARLIPLARATAADVAAWRDLARRACEPNPFFEPEFVLPAQRALGTAARLLVCERDGRWTACLPVRRVLPLVLRTWAHPYCFLATPLMDGDFLAESAAALVGGRRLLVLERQGGDGPVANALAQALRDRDVAPFYEAPHERALLERRSEGGYLDGLAPHRRREFRRQRRRLEEHLGEPLEVRDVTPEAAAVDRFLDLEASGWKGRAGTAMGSRASHATFFREACAGFRALGRLEMLEMSAGDRTLAMKCNLIAGGGAFCFKIAHDETLARFSPGVQLEIAYVEHFHDAREERWADSCAAADNQMINRLWPERRSIVTYAASRPAAHAVFGRGARTYKNLRSRKRSAPFLAS